MIVTQSQTEDVRMLLNCGLTPADNFIFDTLYTGIVTPSFQLKSSNRSLSEPASSNKEAAEFGIKKESEKLNYSR